VEDDGNAVATMVERARNAIAASGAPIFEFKVGVHSPDLEIEMVLAVHDALKGRARVAVDANMGMDFDTARRFLSATSSFLENCEEPVAGLADMDLLGRQFDLNISTHCSDLPTMIHYPAIRGIVPTLDVCGGISAARQISDAGTALGRKVWLRSHAESGIGWAAMVHLGISLPNLRRPAQALIEDMVDDLVTGDCWVVRDGGVVPPEKPGLGVEADWAAIERYHAEYLAIGDVQGFLPEPTNY
jgi:L-alanine-DL-glutamate epimerase-like enolase superfamily enzyme